MSSIRSSSSNSSISGNIVQYNHIDNTISPSTATTVSQYMDYPCKCQCQYDEDDVDNDDIDHKSSDCINSHNNDIDSSSSSSSSSNDHSDNSIDLNVIHQFQQWKLDNN